jgi:oligoribonuclease
VAVDNENLVWIDLEMTGLEPEHDRIIEIASLVTDKDLNILAEGPVMAIHQSDETLDGMDDWNTNTHGKSGLTQRCRDSKTDEQQALDATIKFLEQYVDRGKSPLCGNTIGQDRRFLVRYMRELDDFFHYRSIDVSTIKELTKRWKPETLNGFEKQGAHTALADIRESVAELQYYRKHCFII